MRLRPYTGLGVALFVLAGAVLYLANHSAAASVGAVAVETPGAPVLVELFTSEGCSSCPPADDVLARFASEHPVSGVEVVAMSEHVDYWNSLGWKDPFSDRQYSLRQKDYGRKFGLNGIYTPQMVVDGRTQFVGSSFAKAAVAVKQSAAKSKAAIVLTWLDAATDNAKVRIQIDPVREPADVFLAITEDNLESSVSRGENKGRQLHHMAVVRKLISIGKTETGVPFSAEAEAFISRAWKTSDLHILAFAESHAHGNILALTSMKFPS